MGNGTSVDSSIPVSISTLTGASITGISAGYSFCLASADDGTFWAWGVNAFGQLGDGTQTQHFSPVHVSFSDGSQAGGLAAGASHSLSIQTDGTLRSWGNNSFSQLGNGTTGGNQLSPGAIAGF
jgi:alpha-tubulin suppressor-like RCC1 family protein